jgi:hypothetical protein
MSYQRKTRDVWEVQSYRYGMWECVCSEESRREALKRLHEYRENDSNTCHRLKMVREKIEVPT